MPKYDGDMGAPNLFVPIDDEIRRRKIEHLMTHFATQLSRRWFTEDLFSGLHAAARHGVQLPEHVRRGVLQPQGRAAVALGLPKLWSIAAPARKSARPRTVDWA